jgi:nucleotide-binding universal stress UspA family protein
MSFKKILVPTDFSPGSEYAASVALPVTYAFPPQVLQQLSDDARRGLDAAVRDAVALGTKRVSSKLLGGVPWSAIVDELDEAVDPMFDLVVIGTHGRTGLARVLIGSVAEKVVRHAPCSVLAVHPDGESKPFTHALCPIDFSEGSRQALDAAAELVRPGGAGITLLHVVEAPVAYSGELPDPEMLRDLDRRSSDQLDAWAEALRGRVSVTVATKTRVGWAGAEILAALDRDPSIDLVVVGSHGRTGIKRVLLGSVAEKVVRHARCPVLVARRREAKS